MTLRAPRDSSETVIGLTIVAVGTLVARTGGHRRRRREGRTDVAFGNVVGSNIYNILGVLGITAMIRPLPLPTDLTAVDWGVFVGRRCCSSSTPGAALR
ncbi:MAG: hypothetical protein R3C16_13335 [Hyphomonadaceae bacterium]